MKIYGERLRLSPNEVEVVRNYRKSGIETVYEQSKPKLEAPKILLLDIETAPLSAFLWRLKTEYVNTSMLQNSNWWILSWSAKWLFNNEMMHDVVTGKEAIEEDDGRIALSLWALVNEADICVTHNGKNFDHRMMNMRWMMHGFMPPTPYKVIDTFQVARSNFLFPSYKLDYIAKEIGVGMKVKHEGFGMWKKCLTGNEDSLNQMMVYNDGDVKIMEDIYLVFRPWIKNHPNIGVYAENETPVCSACGSSNLKEDGVYRTNISVFKNFRCMDCGSPHNRQRQNSLPKDLRKKLLSGIPG